MTLEELEALRPQLGQSVRRLVRSITVSTCGLNAASLDLDQIDLRTPAAQAPEAATTAYEGGRTGR